jgi:hypothetical protein
MVSNIAQYCFRDKPMFGQSSPERTINYQNLCGINDPLTGVYFSLRGKKNDRCQIN